MAFWRFTGPAPEAYPQRGIIANPGEVYSFGYEGPPVEPVTDQGVTPTVSYWVSDPGPATANSVTSTALALPDSTRILAKRYLQCDGVTDDSAALTALINALQASTAGYPTPTVIVFPPGTVKLTANQLPAIDPNVVAFTGAGSGVTFLDFGGASNGPVLQYQMAVAAAKSRRIVPLRDLTILGPQSRVTTVDGISLGGTSVYANQLRFTDIQIDGFRDQIIYGSNAYLNVFTGCNLTHARRYAINFSGTITNTAENEIFDNCAISNGEIGLYISPNNTAPKFTFKTTSFDYLDQAASIASLAGSVDFLGCHFEGNYKQITDLVLNSTTTATSASANFQQIDVGKRIADITGQTSIPANATIASVTNSTTIVLSAAATATATITANIASNYYFNDNAQGIVSDHGFTFHGGEVYPAWDNTVRNGFIGISGTINTGQVRVKISGFAILTQTSYTSKYLIVDNSVAGGNGIQTREPSTFDISGTSYIGGISTSYIATYPLRLQDRNGKVYLIHPDFPVVVPPKDSQSWELRQPQYWETMPRVLARDLFTTVSGTMYLVRLSMPDAGWAQVSSATQRFLIAIGSAGSGLTESRITLYRGMVSANGAKDDTNLVAVYNSNNQTSLTASSVNKFSVSLTENISPWQQVWMGVLFIGTTPPTVWGIATGAGTASPLLLDSTNGYLGAAKLTGQANSPSSFARSSLVATEFIPYLAVQPTLS